MMSMRIYLKRIFSLQSNEYYQNHFFKEDNSEDNSSNEGLSTVKKVLKKILKIKLTKIQKVC